MPKISLGEMADDSDKVETIMLDLSDEEVKNFKIGEKVVVTIEGSVGMLSVPPGGSSDDMPGDMGIRISSRKIKGINEFAELSEADDEDED